MSKNFRDIYADVSDSSALEQKFYCKLEATRGEFTPPVGTDFLFSISGGTVNHQIPKKTSPHKTGRHHTTVIREKSSTEWTLPAMFNINEALGAASSAEIDPAVRLLHKSMLGVEDVSAGARYTPGTPNVTFTLLETGDKWSLQVVGAFVESGTFTLPGDGEAQVEWSGSAKTALLIGVAKSLADNDATNVITVETGEGQRFKVGGYVMLVEANGTTRSADTPDGSPRKITSITADAITVDGAVLADADGSGLNAPIYLCYYEPATPTAINNPVTGLSGSISIAGFSGLDCVRSATLTLTNNHELQNNCYGHDGLGGSLFIPGGRFTAELALEINLNHEIVEFLNAIRDDVTGKDIQIILGDVTKRYLQIDMDRVVFSVPEIPVPDSGSIPVTFTSAAILQSAIDAKDEISIHYK